jgi:probable F420-dependent oxidoreductase
MTPSFNPGPNEFGRPRVFVAAVGRAMTRVAAEVANGMLVHAFTTQRYLTEVTVPEITAVRNAVGRSGFELYLPVFVVTGESDGALDAAARATRKQIAFYASTPAYLPVLELHGWAPLHHELNAMSKRGEWDAMAEKISDEVLQAFAVVGHPAAASKEILARFGGVIDRVSFHAPYDLSENARTAILRGIKPQ